MRKTGSLDSSRHPGSSHRIKRVLAGVFTGALIVTGVDLSGIVMGGLTALVGAQQAPVRQVAVNTSITSGDCSYLDHPETYLGVQARHRHEVSRLTQAVSGNFELQTTGLVSPGDIPRRNLIDYILFDTMARGGVMSAPLATDAEFIRRVTIDLTGRIPAPENVISFLQDTSPNKRDALVNSLIASQEFVDKWTMFFGDLFKNTSIATNINRYIVGRETFHQYIRDAIATNKGYNQIATEMITARGDNYANGAVNFIVGGNVPMGPAQDTMDGLAVVTSTTFLGLSSMDCLLCHNGAGHLDQINLWGAKVSRAEAWGMSAFFARTRRTFQRENSSVNYGKYTVTETANGEYQLNTNSGNRQARQPVDGKNTVAPRYLFGGGGVNTGEDRRTALARYITSDPQFARAIVNYIWEELMVEALVSPSNTFDPDRLSANAQLPEGWELQPANPELLEALAQDFISNNYNLRYLIGLIAKSSAYQLSSQYPGEWKIEYVPYYARKFVRRLDAEEIHDAITRATGLPAVTTFREAGSSTSQTVLGFPILGDNGLKIREVQWAMQLPEPREPRQNGVSRLFMDSFLRGDRDTDQRTLDSSILQSLNLMNNSFVNSRIHQGNRITNLPNMPEIPSNVRRLLADPSLTNDQIVTQLFLWTLSRYPTETEKATALGYYSTMTKQAATQGLQWVLLNKVDFIFNY